MLKSLNITNIALIEKIFIEFNNGLNVLTGETGAGKSIIFDSLNFVLGARSDKTLIRTGESSARVDAVFEIDNQPNLVETLKEFDIEFDGDILISRKMNVDGKGDIKVNGYPVTLAMLRQITANLVDIYGQQEEVGLLKQNSQLYLLDSFAGSELSTVFVMYKQKLSNLKGIDSKLNDFGGDNINIEREKDYLSFVIKEIESENLSESEEQELILKKQKLANIEKISSQISTMQTCLHTAIPQVNSAILALNSAKQYDETLNELCERLNGAKFEIEDIFDSINQYEVSDFSQAEFDRIDDRLDRYKALKRKYGNSIDEINEFLNKSKNRLNDIENGEAIRRQLNLDRVNVVESLFDYATKMNAIRKKYATIFCEKVLLNLKNLGMPNAQLCFEFKDAVKEERFLTSHGLGEVELMFTANLGGELKPLNKVASGGELSRLMLAIKTIIAEYDNMPTMIFDEIDTGISGKMAQAVSEKMADISKYHQVIAITHSVQIASMADRHYLIKKIEKDGKTSSMVNLLNYEERIEEIARFMSATSLTENTKLSAKELIESQLKYKSK